MDNYNYQQKLALGLDSLALLLYCSELYHGDYTSLDLLQWNDLEKKIRSSQLKRPAALLSLKAEVLMLNLNIDEALAKNIEGLNLGLPYLLEQLQSLETLGILVTTKYEELYPEKLKQKMKKQAPLFLYYAGNMNLLNQKLCFLTGPNKSNSHIDGNSRKSIDKLNDENYSLLVGGNRGVEHYALKYAMRTGSRGVEFICGNLISELKNQKKYIKSGQLLLISARNPYATFDMVEAIDRNQYIFCLSEFVLVMYSQINSGAIWLSAMQNFKMKWTKLAALVDDEFHGNARLIEHGAVGLTMDMIKSTIPFIDLLDREEEQIMETQRYDQLTIYNFLGEENE